MSKNRSRDPELAKEQAAKDTANSTVWNAVADDMETNGTDIQSAWVNYWRNK